MSDLKAQCKAILATKENIIAKCSKLWTAYSDATRLVTAACGEKPLQATIKLGEEAFLTLQPDMWTLNTCETAPGIGPTVSSSAAWGLSQAQLTAIESALASIKPDDIVTSLQSQL